MDLKSKILAAVDVQKKAVVIPEWEGVEVFVYTMTAAEREAFESREKGEACYAHLLVSTLRDAEGKTVFTVEDVPALSEKSGNVVARLVALALGLNKIGEAQVQGAVKN